MPTQHTYPMDERTFAAHINSPLRVAETTERYVSYNKNGRVVEGAIKRDGIWYDNTAYEDAKERADRLEQEAARLRAAIADAATL